MKTRRIVTYALSTLGLLLVAAIVFIAWRARPFLTPELRTRSAFESFAERGLEGPESIDVPFEGTSIRAYSTGLDADDLDGPRPLVIFVHGSPGDWTDFTDQLADPVLRNAARLVSVDRLGYGGSDYGHAEGSMSRQAEAVGAVIKFLGAPPAGAILVGHSLGAPVAIRLAMDHPELVGGLVSVAGSADPALEETKWIQIPGNWPVIRALIPTMLDVCNQEILPHKDELETMRSMWASIRCPLTVIQGERDSLVPPANADFIARMTTAVQVDMRRFDDMSHFVPWSHPQRIRRAILDLIDSIDMAIPGTPAAVTKDRDLRSR